MSDRLQPPYRHERTDVDVVVVGSGPNGLAAAVIAACAGLSVHVFEAQPTAGGGLRTESIVASDALHDVCSHAHPLALLSPFFRAFDLQDRGVQFLTPTVQYGQPVDRHHAVAAFQDVERTCAALGDSGRIWRRAIGPLAANIDDVAGLSLSQLRPPTISNPIQARYLATVAAMMASGGRLGPADSPAAALMAGVSAHAISPLHQTGLWGKFGAFGSLGPAAVGIVLAALAHGVGWPLPRGGSGHIARALIDCIRHHGGQVTTNRQVTTLAQLPRARAIICDVSPRMLVSLLGEDCPTPFARQIHKYQHRTAVSKFDFVLSAPVPWRHTSLQQAGTIHLGGPWTTVARSEQAVSDGVLPHDLFLLFGQPWVVDKTRAPSGQVTFSGYAHVPLGWSEPILDQVCSQIEHHAPGFRDTIVSAREVPAAHMSAHNANYIGGDISCGAVSLTQVLARPRPAWNPYRTPVDGVYLCSAATPPGPGVHGMCGVYAMRHVLRDRFGIATDPLKLIAREHPARSKKP